MLGTYNMPLLIQNKNYLIDSNSYFRLANSLHPLLGSVFGTNNYIYIIKEFDSEFSKSLNLQNKFSWVNQDEYTANRKHKITYNQDVENAVSNHIKYIKLFAKENFLDVSPVDIKYLAVALELNMTLISDDYAMLMIAEDFEIKILKTLDLLKLMLDSEHLKIEKVKEITDYLIYNKDIPKDFKKDCKKLFNFDY